MSDSQQNPGDLTQKQIIDPNIPKGYITLKIDDDMTSGHFYVNPKFVLRNDKGRLISSDADIETIRIYGWSSIEEYNSGSTTVDSLFNEFRNLNYRLEDDSDYSKEEETKAIFEEVFEQLEWDIKIFERLLKAVDKILNRELQDKIYFSPENLQLMHIGS